MASLNGKGVGVLHNGDSWIAVASETQTIRGYLDEEQFVEGSSEGAILKSQRELMRFRLWLEANKCRFEDALHLQWSGKIIHSETECWVQGETEEEGYIRYESPENWMQAWFEFGPSLCLVVETLESGQYLQRTRWQFQLMRSIRSDMRLDISLSPILKAIADRPLDSKDFSGILNLRQWSISPEELFVLLERPELTDIAALDAREIWRPDAEGVTWVLQNAWHAQSLKKLHLSATSIDRLDKIIDGQDFQSLILSDYICQQSDIDLLSSQSSLEDLSFGGAAPLDLSVLEACPKLTSLVTSAPISNWSMVMLQNLERVKLPNQRWGIWTEDLQLHQISHFQIGDIIPARDILHLESLRVLDMHMPEEGIDSFSLSTLIVRGGRLSVNKVRQIMIGCPLLGSVYIVDSEVEDGVFAELKHLKSVGFERCRIAPQPKQKNAWEWVLFRGSQVDSATVLNSLSGSVRQLDISHTGMRLDEIYRDPRFVDLHVLIADGVSDPESLFQANALISLNTLSLREVEGCAASWIQEQGCIGLQSLDLGGMSVTHSDISAASLASLRNLRLAPQPENSVIQELRHLINPNAFPRVQHDLPMFKMNICDDEFWSF